MKRVYLLFSGPLLSYFDHSDTCSCSRHLRVVRAPLSYV